MIGGAITHYFKKNRIPEIEILAPNSKRLSLRELDDFKYYFWKYRPDFIINCAIAPIDSDAQLAFEVNYLGAINLAKVALALKIPYIFLSSASVMPAGVDLTEENRLPLNPGMSNYRKSKLMAEQTLEFMHRTEGLDFTTIRLGVVYGKHDHKIQGFQRLLFSLAGEAMPFMLTKRGVCHSYTNTKKVPLFIDYILDHRQEFSGQTYNFVDPEPVELARAILTVKSYLNLSMPKEIFIPYPLARMGRTAIRWLIRRLSIIGVDVRFPAELTFLNDFYSSQTLSAKKLTASSYGSVADHVTVFTEIPDMLEYYLTRWEHLNLISGYNSEFYDPQKRAAEFVDTPAELLQKIHESDFTAKSDLTNLL